jgi:hypothetical protein
MSWLQMLVRVLDGELVCGCLFQLSVLRKDWVHARLQSINVVRDAACISTSICRRTKRLVPGHIICWQMMWPDTSKENFKTQAF